MTQTEIDQRETARVEAILQCARWGLHEVILQQMHVGSHDLTVPVRLVAAIQHDDPQLADDEVVGAELRHAVVMDGLDILAEFWTQLPEGERDLVLAGILSDPGDPASAWYRLVDLSVILSAWPKDQDPELRSRRNDEYARLLRRLTDAVVSA